MSFSGLGALITAFVICAVTGPFIIPALRKLHFGQSIRECGPKEHKKKNGTPTMGGVMIIFAIIIATLVWCDLSPQVWLGLLLLVGHGVIGFIDDFIKVVKKHNLGLTSKQKFLLQVLLAVAFLIYITVKGETEGFGIWIPGLNTTVNLGLGYYIFAILLLVGTTNAVNLTDGLDGLVSWVTVPVSLALGYIAYGVNEPSLGIFAMTISGACLGFLLFNHYPAKIFMGDTGSLALGGGIAALSLLTKTEILLVIIGAVYVIETLSVILQVSYFKYTHGKRIFRMSPLHHHFELGGWKETKVVFVFTMISCVCSLFGVYLALPILK